VNSTGCSSLARMRLMAEEPPVPRVGLFTSPDTCFRHNDTSKQPRSGSASVGPEPRPRARHDCADLHRAPRPRHRSSVGGVHKAASAAASRQEVESRPVRSAVGNSRPFSTAGTRRLTVARSFGGWRPGAEQLVAGAALLYAARSRSEISLQTRTCDELLPPRRACR
jgi:hypothetical protein